MIYLIKLKNGNVFEGIRKDDSGHYIFDKMEDFPTDLLDLCKDTSGVFESGNITYVYGYTFNKDVPKELATEFRNALKHKFNNSDLFYDNSVFDFVEDGVFALDRYKRLEDFKVLITVRPIHDEISLLYYVDTIITEYSSTSFVTFDLIKKLCSEVTFDENKAFDALRQTTKYSNKSDSALRRIVHNITLELQRVIKKDPMARFQMKRYMPVVARVGFSSFVKFKNEFDEQLYKNLENGTDVLICDDFATSGSTLKEMRNFLMGVNPNNNITAFALINQNRNY